MSWWMWDLQNVPWREASLVTAAIRCRWRDRERNADTAGGASPLSHRGRPCPLPGTSTPCWAFHGDGSALPISAAAAPRERGRFEGSGLVMLSAVSFGARAEEKAQIPLPFFSPIFNSWKLIQGVFSMFSLLEIKLILWPILCWVPRPSAMSIAEGQCCVPRVVLFLEAKPVAACCSRLCPLWNGWMGGGL